MTPDKEAFRDESGRIRPGDKIPHDRREEPRRAEDKDRRDALKLRFAFYRRAALIAALGWAIVSTVAAISLVIAVDQKGHALDRADTALNRATAALHRADTATDVARRIQRSQYEEALQSCRDQNARLARTIGYIHLFGVLDDRKHGRSPAPLRKGEPSWERGLSQHEVAGLAPFVILESDAIPHRDCRSWARSITRTSQRHS